MINQDKLKEYLHYNEETGELTWIKKPSKKVLPNSRAGSLTKSGYRHIIFDNKKYPEHRLIWFYVHGKFPDGQIDHINHIRDDNRLCNLREVSHSENARNRTKNKSSRVQEVGIWYCKRRKRYIAEITLNQKKVYQRSFENIDDAIQARKQKAKELGFHDNHGE